MCKLSWLAIAGAVVGAAACQTEDTSKFRDPHAHNYGHDLAAPAAPRASAACTPQDLQALVAGYMNPPLMAIGDSLYNGVSSLRINWWLSEWSVPSQVAIGLGLIPQDEQWQRVVDDRKPRLFWGPQYPGVDKSDYDGDAPNYGFNVERIGLSAILFDNALGNAGASLVELSRYRPASGRLFNDNLAFSGADTIDLLYRSARSMHDRLVSPRPGLGQSNDLAVLNQIARSGPLTGAKNVSSIARGFYLINAEFVLNPSRNPCIENLTAVDQVLLRKPKRLLVNIGSNNGIYRMGLEGVRLFTPVTDDYAGRCTCIADYLGDTYIKDMAELIRKLEAEDAVESVYINSLIPPSRIANLEPDPQTGDQRLPGAPHYFKSYATDFSVGGSRRIPGEEVQRADEFVAEIVRRLNSLIDGANARVALKRAGQPAAAGAPAKKFVLVDVDEITARYDYKHTPVDERRLLIARGTPGKADVYFDMRALRFDQTPRVYGNVAAGGFVSFDNMHLTSPGYAVLSGAVLEAIKSNEKVSYPQLQPLISPRNMYVLKSNAPYSFIRYGTDSSEAIRDRLSNLVAKMAGETQTCPIANAPRLCADHKLPPWGEAGR
ncbi:MAG: hypothetical protein FJX11_11115 [Alphaproteobacteria bacterium]|nr:hypothetical protein [Alphaproteobacteria bacterium]